MNERKQLTFLVHKPEESFLEHPLKALRYFPCFPNRSKSKEYLLINKIKSLIPSAGELFGPLRRTLPLHHQYPYDASFAISLSRFLCPLCMHRSKSSCITTPNPFASSLSFFSGKSLSTLRYYCR